jgi:hypothetical protein
MEMAGKGNGKVWKERKVGSEGAERSNPRRKETGMDAHNGSIGERIGMDARVRGIGQRHGWAWPPHPDARRPDGLKN